MATHDFTGKVAMVTGGGSGMGRSTAIAFAAAGARTVVVDLSEEAARATADFIQEQGGEGIAVRCDVTRSEDVKAALEETAATYGRLDAAFNNAGLEHGLIAAAEIPDAEFDRIVGVSLKGVFLSMKYQIPLMLAGGGGAIVNNSSAAGLSGFKGQAAYSAAKHGLVGLTRSAALDYASENVRINAICPGIVDTPMMDRVTGGTPNGRAAVITMEPIGRMGRPEEIADTVLWLCSDASSFVVGHALSVDGGMSAGQFGER
jgi:NAD(P)-dependent dehydrogenase (short-subunit alcohol dehydrogenase family)